MSETTPPAGIALLCTKDGAIQSVITATLDGAEVRHSLCGSVEPPSSEACALFVKSVTRGGFARSTPLRIGSRDVHCFGLCRNDELKIVAVVDPLAAGPFAESIEGFDDLAREIRRTHSTYELYEELARVNNELVTTQRELARTVAELKRLNAWKDELLGVAAHDLRNPLNANDAFITFLIEDSAHMTDNNLVLLDRLRATSRYMLRLVEDVLDFSAIEAGHVRLHPEETAVESLVQNVVATMRILAEGKNVAIAFRGEEGLPRLRVDRIKISQAVQNVVSNAVQYSPPGSQVDVRMHARGGGVEIEVEDRGPGIPTAELPLLFKPFTRLSTVRLAKQRSVGLGLAITRRLVEAHGGTIEVESEVDRGSVFTIRLRPSPSAAGETGASETFRS
jgi:two-component system sensor histidine kinase/response regulator